MGLNVKFVLPICDFIFERKNRGNFFIRKKTIPLVRGGVWQKTIKNTFFLEPFPKVNILSIFNVEAVLVIVCHFINENYIRWGSLLPNEHVSL